MSASESTAPALDDRDMEPRTPMKRLGSTRKLAAFSNIRVQLSEQTRVLEARAEATAGVAGELHDYCRRRADLEHEYSRALDKLARAAHQRHKDQKHKREQWSLTGAFACWQAALDSTRSLARDHAALADLYAGPLAARTQRAADDALRLHRKCRDIVSERHEEVSAALAEAAAAGKAHGAASAAWRTAALKLRHAYDARRRHQQADPPRHKKIKALDKELEKRVSRHSEARVVALRARAEYVLALEAANATLQRYYLDDIADLMLCMEVGFEAVVGRAVRTAGAAEEARGRRAAVAASALRAAAAALDPLADRQRVVDAHSQLFAVPRPLPYQGPPPAVQDAEMRDTIGEAAAAAAAERDAGVAGVAAELAARLHQLDALAAKLRLECDEHAKTLDAAEAELVRQMEGDISQWEVGALFAPDTSPPPAPPAPPGTPATCAPPAALPTPAPPTPAPPTEDPDAPRRDQEDYYLAKFRTYVSCAGRLARLESKAAAVRGQLAGAGEGEGGAPPARAPAPHRRPRRGQFAAPLQEALPAVLTSCVRVIVCYGLKHQGLFRVSGSQVEMQALRAAFERGEDPLEHVRDASDINSVCGLLKLYLRELRPPLLPPQLQERALRVAASNDRPQFVRRMRALLAALPTPALLLLRYLFAFLAHVSEYSEYNMMDAWNLAICMGPTLLPAWGEGGAQVTAQNLVNELVKQTILLHREVFPQHLAPHTLYRPPQPPPTHNDSTADGEGESESVSEATNEAEPEVGAECDSLDAPDRLSLYGSNDANDTDEVSEDDDSSEWREHVPTHRRCVSVERGGSAGVSPQQANDVNESSEVQPVVGSRVSSRLAESTPDLVLDLPSRPAPPPRSTPPPAPLAAAPSAPTAPALSPPAPDAADVFLHNRDTLKKKPAHRQTRSEGGADTECLRGSGDSESETESGAGKEAGAGAGAGSPVPARNTARVAAKFAELTLTGGSLKPALAAKPALMRRPTPHPHAPHAPLAPRPRPPDEPTSDPAPAPAPAPDT